MDRNNLPDFAATAGKNSERHSIAIHLLHFLRCPSRRVPVPATISGSHSPILTTKNIKTVLFITTLPPARLLPILTCSQLRSGHSRGPRVARVCHPTSVHSPSIRNATPREVGACQTVRSVSSATLLDRSPPHLAQRSQWRESLDDRGSEQRASLATHHALRWRSKNALTSSHRAKAAFSR